MQLEMEELRSSSVPPPSRNAAMELIGGTEPIKKKKRRIISIRRFKINSDGTKKLVSVVRSSTPGTPGLESRIESRNSRND